MNHSPEHHQTLITGATMEYRIFLHCMALAAVELDAYALDTGVLGTIARRAREERREFFESRG